MGGVLTFDFDSPQYVNRIGLVDIEETGGFVRLLDSSGGIIGDVVIPSLGDASFQELTIDVIDVSTMEVHLAGSGAVTDYCISDEVPECYVGTTHSIIPSCTGIVNGFSINPQNGSPLISLTDGMTLCSADFAASDLSLIHISEPTRPY